MRAKREDYGVPMEPIEHVEVAIVGAGLSGIGAAWHLQANCPNKSYAIFEGRADIGGTWDLFRYPGVRSDSDMHTLGYRFKPWTSDKAIADGPSIMAYLRETISEYGIGPKIRFQHKVTDATWDSSTGKWTLSIARGDTGGVTTASCNVLYMCSGYYSYEKGYTPEFPGADSFRGQLVHPQKWPQGLDYSGKRVVVVGSGATAMTLVPAMASSAAHVTMLQRTPTYVVARPDVDKVANTLRKIFPASVAYAITRWKNTTMQQLVYRKTRTKPDYVKSKLLDGVREHLGPSFDVDTHFTPDYDPWDQRLCLVPNGDLFSAINSGKASVVTDHIESFDATGVRLVSGEHLEADIIVTATGLQLVTVGDMKFSIDGRRLDFADTWTYKGMGYSGVPNMVSTFGYINASWTLRADLTSEYVCRLLNHMDSTGTDVFTPTLRPDDQNMTPHSWIESFSPGYMRRFMDKMPKQGDREPWINPQNYAKDKKMFRKAPIEDGVMRFTRVTARV
jgi:cation diffusion facilitator CzcD-associated flavoprotein CzcO